MSKYLQSLDGMLGRAWLLMEQGAAARLQVAFATLGPDGWPEARTVVLRRAERQAAVLEIYTDTLSDKIASLQALPRASVLIWDKIEKLQIRAQVDVTVQTGEQTDAAWAAVPDQARQSYGVIPPPGTVIAAPEAYKKPSTQDQFAVLRCRIHALDVVSLADPHRRAAFRSQGGEWDANWLAP